MPRRKLKKYQEIQESDWYKDIVEEVYNLDTQEWFGNTNPVVLELGAGYGEYAIGLAEQNPDVNYIAIDIKSDRLWMGLQWAKEKGLKNVRFLRCEIYRVDEIFTHESISDIWLTFSDPQPNKPKKRLTHPIFLKKYHTIQRNESSIFVKTDSDLLYHATMKYVHTYTQYDLVVSTSDPTPDMTKNITTRYEKKFSDQGYSIKFIELKKSH